MATYDELFGKKSSGPKRPPQPKWENEGDSHVGVVSGEPQSVPQRDFEASKDKYMVKTGGGKNGWEVKNEGDFNTELDNFALTQIALPVTIDGVENTIYFTGQREDALKDAMQDTGIPLVPGTTIGIKFLRRDGKRKIWSVKLVAAK